MDNEDRVYSSDYLGALTASDFDDLEDGEESEAGDEEAFLESEFGSPLPARFSVVTRDGRYFSYPYSHVGLIECPSPDRVTLHCNCSKIKTIEIRGRGLRPLADSLTEGRLRAMFETARPKYARGETVIVEILRT